MGDCKGVVDVVSKRAPLPLGTGIESCFFLKRRDRSWDDDEFVLPDKGFAFVLVFTTSLGKVGAKAPCASRCFVEIPPTGAETNVGIFAILASDAFCGKVLNVGLAGTGDVSASEKRPEVDWMGDEGITDG